MSNPPYPPLNKNQEIQNPPPPEIGYEDETSCKGVAMPWGRFVTNA